MSAFFVKILKSVSSLKFVLFLHGVLDPLTHNKIDLKIQKESFVLNKLITVAYCSFSFSAILAARFFINIVHSCPMPPFVPKTNGVNVACSTSTILSRYVRFFSASFRLKISSTGRFLLLSELTCVIRTSKNAFCPRRQKPPA